MVTPVAAPFLSAAFSLRSRSSSAFRSSSDIVTPGQLERPNGSFKSLSGTYPRFKLSLKILRSSVEILRAVALGVLLGVIYVWPFAASRSYKRLIVSGVTTGRIVALLQKIVSLIVWISVALAAVIVVRAFSSKALAWIDFMLFLGTAVASGWLAWRYIYKIPRL